MDSQLTIIPILLLHGLVYGMLIFLVASGLTLVLGLMDILNFAHVSIYMIGAFICLIDLSGFPLGRHLKRVESFPKSTIIWFF